MPLKRGDRVRIVEASRLGTIRNNPNAKGEVSFLSDTGLEILREEEAHFEPLPTETPETVRITPTSPDGFGEYTFEVQSFARIRLILQVLTPSEDADSLFYSLDDEPQAVWFAESGWSATHTVWRLILNWMPLTFGTHRLKLARREAGVRVTGIALTSDPDWPLPPPEPIEPTPEPEPEPEPQPEPEPEPIPEPEPMPGGSGPRYKTFDAAAIPRVRGIWERLPAWRGALQRVMDRPVSGHSGDHWVLGQAEALAFAATGARRYFEQAMAVRAAFFGAVSVSDSVANLVRERFIDVGWTFYMLRPAMSTAQAREEIAIINSWVAWSLAREEAGSMLWDTDQVTGCLCGLYGAMEATRADNPRAASSLAHPVVERWQRRLDGWIEDAWSGGIWMEGSAYSPSTLLVLLCAAAQRPAWTLARSFFHQVAAAMHAQFVPDLSLPNETGDVQSDYQGRMLFDRWLPLIYSLTSLDGDAAGQMRQCAADLETAHGLAPGQFVSPRAFLLADPEGDRRPWTPAHPRRFLAPGQGIFVGVDRR